MQETNTDTLEKAIQLASRKPILEDITLVIPTLGRPILEVCLSKVIGGSFWPQGLIVIHQGDEPNIEKWVNQIRKIGIEAVYLHSAVRGKPAAINIAFARTLTRFICMTDDDCFVDADWLINMHTHLRSNPEWIITGRVEPAGNEKIAIIQLRDASVQFRPKLKFDLFVGGNMGAAMDIVRRVGLFDEDPLLRSAAEDVEWGYRALRMGIPIAYAPDVAVSHFGWRADQEERDRLKAYAHGHGSFYGKYLRKGDLFILLRAASHLVRALRRWFHGIMTGNPDQAKAGQAYFTGLVPGIVAGFRSKFRAGQLL